MSRSESQSHTYQLTIRLEGELARRVKDVAKQSSVSLNQAVVKLLRSAAGLDRRSGEPIGTRLDRYVGTITSKERAELDAAVEEAFGQPDPEMWK